MALTSSSLPRNMVARNTNIHQKKNIFIQTKRIKSQLKDICLKHKIDTLSFRSCKFANNDGKITFVDHEEIIGNFRRGIIIVKATSITTDITNNLYDLVEIMQKKKERIESKQKEDSVKEILEIERLKQNEINLNKEGKKFNEKKNDVDELDNIYNDNHHDNHHDKDAINIENSDQVDAENNDGTKSEKIHDVELKNDDEIKLDKNDNVKKNSEKNDDDNTDLNKEVVKKEIVGKKEKKNKYFRNFMKDIQNKFCLEEITDFNFFEVKADTTDMVIENVKVYKISLPSYIKEIQLLVVGDIQMKNDLIRQIDPSYKADEVLKKHNDFLDRIKSKEKNITTEYMENSIIDESDEDKSDELNELEISDSDIDSEKKV